MNNTILRTLTFLLLIAGISACQSSSRTDQVCFREQCFNVEIARTSEEFMRGLQLRPSLPPDAGMLFIFPETKQHNFWMKDTLIPLDIIWLDSGRQVVFIAHNAQPCKEDPCPLYIPSGEAMYVLELNAHQAKALNMREGNQLEFHLNGVNSVIY